MTWQDTFIKIQQIPTTERPTMPVPNRHEVLGVPMQYPFVERGGELDTALDGVLFGMGCFGVRSVSFGNLMVCTAPLWVTVRVRLFTPHIKKCVRV